MSARSSLRNLAVLAVAIGACHRGPKKPEADPAKIKELAARMVDNSPVPAALDRCAPADLDAPVTVTFRTLQLLAGHTIEETTVQDSDWINPTPLDLAAARTLLDDKADETDKREAAGEMLAARSWIIYRIDLVNAPMALGAKELKTGTINGRVIRYDRKSGQPTCVYVWNFQNTREKTDWAISVSNKPYIDPAVMKVLRDDLVAQYLANVPRAATVKPSVPAPHQ